MAHNPQSFGIALLLALLAVSPLIALTDASSTAADPVSKTYTIRSSRRLLPPSENCYDSEMAFDNEKGMGELFALDIIREVTERKPLKIYQIDGDTFGMDTLTGDSVRIRGGESLVLTLNRWGGEYSLNTEVPFGTFSLPVVRNENRIEWGTDHFRIAVYPRGPENVVLTVDNEDHVFEQMSGGGLEYDVTIKDEGVLRDSQTGEVKNRFEFPIDTENLDYYYQPPLHEDHPTWADEDNDGEPDAFRPKNVVGSYAVYHGWKMDNNYRAEKIFHIYRPRIYDDSGDWVWGDLKIDEEKGSLTVTVPQGWLDDAIFPVRVDPTFGYDNEGKIPHTCSADRIFTNAAISPDLDGIGDNISLYCGGGGHGTTSLKCALYDNSDNSLIGKTEEIIVSSDAENKWRTLNFISPAPRVGPEKGYWISFWVGGNDLIVWHDTGSSKYRDENYDSWPAFIDRWDGNPDKTYSIYLSYHQPKWQAAESWTGSLSAPAAGWNSVGALAGDISASGAGWTEVGSWSASARAYANWSLVESCSGTPSAPAAAWKDVEAWTANISPSAAEWGKVGAWTGTSGAPARWSSIGSWSGITSSPVGWQAAESWTGSLSAPAAGWNSVGALAGDISASGAGWTEVGSWSASARAYANWSLVESCSGTPSAPAAAWKDVEAWTANISPSAAEWGKVGAWTGTSGAPARWSSIGSWSTMISSPEFDRSFTKKQRKKYKAPILAWNSIESCSGIIGALAPTWNKVGQWSKFVKAPSIQLLPSIGIPTLFCILILVVAAFVFIVLFLHLKPSEAPRRLKTPVRSPEQKVRRPAREHLKGGKAVNANIFTKGQKRAPHRLGEAEARKSKN